MTSDVMIYTDPNCPHCRRLKHYLDEHHIPYRNRDVTSDPAAVEELTRMNAPGVPVTRIGSETVIGFDPGRIEELLHAAAR